MAKATPQPKAAVRATNVRRVDEKAIVLLSRLRTMVRDHRDAAFEIGDLVNRLIQTHGMTVTTIAAAIGGSRQRLSELRRTATAFPPAKRGDALDIHYYTIAARAARKLGLDPAAVLREVVRRRFRSVRHATAYFAAKIREREALKAVASPAAVAPAELINSVHHADFRTILPRLPDGAAKLIAADAPYGKHGRWADGRHATTSVTRRACDAMRDDEAKALVTDLLSTAMPKLAPGGCLILFRPGGEADPAWLVQAIEEHGWAVARALTWDKGTTKLGRGDEAYTVATERLLVLCRAGDRLVNHDGSPRGDVLRVPPIRPRSAGGLNNHVFEKPYELCRRLIAKHTHAGELVFEPFGGSGAFSRAAAALGRRWVCCETRRDNHAAIAAAVRQIVRADAG